MFFRFYNWLKTSAGPAVPTGSPGPAVPAIPTGSPGAAVPAIPTGSPGAAVPTGSPGAAVPTGSPVIPCRFIAVGKECQFKDQCVYSHDVSIMKTCQIYLAGLPCKADDCKKEHSSDNAPVCFHFMNGNCKKTKCRFKHIEQRVQDSQDLHDCLVCYTDIRYGKKFALLQCCDICVCTDCMLSNGRRCPICKMKYTFIVHSNVLLKGDEKKAFIDSYLANKKRINCQFGDTCKYNKCIYGH